MSLCNNEMNIFMNKRLLIYRIQNAICRFVNRGHESIVICAKAIDNCGSLTFDDFDFYFIHDSKLKKIISKRYDSKLSCENDTKTLNKRNVFRRYECIGKYQDESI